MFLTFFVAGSRGLPAPCLSPALRSSPLSSPSPPAAATTAISLDTDPFSRTFWFQPSRRRRLACPRPPPFSKESRHPSDSWSSQDGGNRPRTGDRLLPLAWPDLSALPAKSTRHRDIVS